MSISSRQRTAGSLEQGERVVEHVPSHTVRHRRPSQPLRQLQQGRPITRYVLISLALFSVSIPKRGVRGGRAQVPREVGARVAENVASSHLVLLRRGGREENNTALRK